MESNRYSSPILMKLDFSR